MLKQIIIFGLQDYRCFLNLNITRSASSINFIKIMDIQIDETIVQKAEEIQPAGSQQINPFLLHGIFMTLVWTVMAITQVSLNRYLKTMLWRKGQLYHILLGLFMYGITLSMALFALFHRNWQFDGTPHSFIVFPTFSLLFVLPVFGCCTKYNSLSGKWNTAKTIKIKRWHKFLGYSWVVIGQIALFSGIYSYRHQEGHMYSTPFEFIQLGIFLIIVFILEIIHQVKQATFIPIKGNDCLGLITLDYY